LLSHHATGCLSGFSNLSEVHTLPADLPECGQAFFAWQLIEYASSTRPFPQFLLNSQGSRTLPEPS
jgi:hypothetical protein